MRVSGRQQRIVIVFLLIAMVLLLIPMFLLSHNQSVDQAIYQHRLILGQSTSQPINQLSRYRIAWAIPVGGKTDRLHRVKSILHDLISGGAGRENVFVMEDDGSRSAPSAALAATTRAWGVNHLKSHVRRGPEPPELFGLHLARHYHYMMDALLLSPNDELSLSSPSQAEVALGYDFVVILEDDLRLAPDAVKYFHAMAAVMDADASLLCACAHADNAFYATTRSESELLRDHHHHRTADVMNFTLSHRPHKPVDNAEKLSSMFFGADGVEVMVVNEDDEQGHHKRTNDQSITQSINASPFVTLASSEFDFRRGQHFMAPGWMTSSTVYKRIRPDWFDSQLNLPFKEKLNMPNGNWDAFMDAQAFHRKLECLYPEIPRIAHQGANGYTVSAAMQAELFDNLRLSTLPSTIEYGPLTRLELNNYDAQVLSYISSCTRVTSLPEIGLYRRSNLCLMLPTQSDKDPLFAELFSGYFGVVSIGGHAHYGKQRGIHHGAVFTRWLTNLILVIGAHGMFAHPFFHLHSLPGEMQMLEALQKEATETSLSRRALGDMYVGCFSDSKYDRLLPHQLGSVNPVRPLACLSACQLHGYTHSGVEWGWECWCGMADTVTQGRRVLDTKCNSRCVATWDDKMRDATAVSEGTYTPVDQACGGDLTLSVLTSSANSESVTDNKNGQSGDWKHLKALPLPATKLSNVKSDVDVIVASPGKSCDDACSAATPSMECDDALLALIHSDCSALKKLLGCLECEHPTSPWDGFAAPGQRSSKSDTSSTSGNCVLSRGKYLRCNAVPPDAGYRRACTCVKPT